MELCAYIESGFPILSSLAGHVITVIGHTLDYSRTCTPDNDFIDHSQFYKQLIVVDDNFFPYQLLGYNSDPDNYASLPSYKYNINSIYTAVCPLPEKVFLTADKVRSYAIKVFNEYKSELKKIARSPWVIRLFLTTAKSFKMQKNKFDKGNKNIRFGLILAQLSLPHFIWVMEVSSIDLYKKGECISELIMDPTAGNKEDSTLYLRLGNDLVISDFERKIPLTDSAKTFPQYSHNLG